MGAILNAQLIPKIYPGWTARFYCASSVPSTIIDTLEAENSEIIKMPDTGNNTSMFWRFLVFSDPSVDYAIIRDTDSRISFREAACVNDWLKSNCSGHVLRDHPIHDRLIMGGMWGAKAEILRNIEELINGFVPIDTYDNDQQFLSKVVYPILKVNGLCVHDSFYKFEIDARDFIAPRVDYEFVGEIFNDKDLREDHYKYIENISLRPTSELKFFFRRIWKIFVKRVRYLIS